MRQLKIACFVFIFSLFQMARAETDDLSVLTEDALNFNLPEPTSLGREYNPWATNYYVPFTVHIDNGIPLLDLSGRQLGPKIVELDWCKGALEGTIRIQKKDGTNATYNYSGIASAEQVQCKGDYSKFDKIGHTRFHLSSTDYGEGINNYLLVPFRSVATAKKEFAPGTLIYIPTLRGQWITLPSGVQVQHDGYYFVADTGGALNRHSEKPGWEWHLDLFTGNDEKPNISVVTNSPQKRFQAFEVKDAKIRAVIEALHRTKN